MKVNAFCKNTQFPEKVSVWGGGLTWFSAQNSGLRVRVRLKDKTNLREHEGKDNKHLIKIKAYQSV